MKKRGILTVGLIAATLALTSCDINELLHQNYVNPVPGEDGQGGGGSGGDKTQYGVTIENKSDLQVEWRVNDPNRTISIAVTPKANITTLINSGELTITSSNAAAVKVEGRSLVAAGAGTATVTVAYKNATDSVQITVLEKLSNKTKFGIQHEGTLEDPLDNTDACKVGEYCNANNLDATEEFFYIKGEVDSFYHLPGSRSDGAVSWYLKKGANDTARFEVYKAYFQDADKKKVNIGEDDIWVGAITTVYSKITYYKDGKQPETTGDVVLTKVEGTKPETHTYDVNVAGALDAINALEDGATSADKYNVTGYIVKVTTPYDSGYGNISFTMADAIGGSPVLTAYRVKCSAEQAEKLLVGAQVKVSGNLQKYVSGDSMTPEIAAGGTVEILKESEGEPEIKINEVTFAQAYEVANALEHNKTTDDKYATTGYVTEIVTAFNAQYGNISFNFAAEKGGTTVLQAYRAKVTDEVAAKILVGAEVKVTGYLKKYNTTLEFDTGCEVEIVKEAEGEAPVETVNEVTFAQAYEVADALEHNKTTTDKYATTGYVTEIVTAFNAQFGNISFNFAAEKGGTTVLQAYRCVATEEVAAKIKAGAQVKVTGKLKKYNTTLEFDAGCTVEVLKEAEGETPVETVNEVTFAQAYEVANALEHNKTTDDKYATTGYVTEIVTAFNSQYGNISFNFAAEKGGTTVLQAYRCVATEEVAAKIKVGAQVKVTGKLKKYNTTLEFDTGCTVEVLKEAEEEQGGGQEGQTQTLSYTISSYTAGTQYAENEEHVLDTNTTVYTTQCHFTTEIRMYSSSSHDGFVVIKSVKEIKSITLNAGNKSDTLVVTESTDGSSYSALAEVAVATSYANTSELETTKSGIHYIKLDVKGDQQLRIKSFSLKVVA